MKVAFRVDASSKIGTGHFMRCLTLATGLKQRGAQIRFVSRHMPEHLRDMVRGNGFEFSPLKDSSNQETADDGAYASWLGVSQAQDARDTSHALLSQSWEWLVVDHYGLDVRWETALRDAVGRILVIDDIADRQHDCDVLLDQNFYENMDARYISKVPADCLLLLGPRYALLREEFRQSRTKITPRVGPIRRVLVFFGGVDEGNATGCAIEALSSVGSPRLFVDVVIGEKHPCRNEIQAECERHGFICHVQTTRMAELMAAADLAIGAGGSASWERCCLGLPALIVALADNQIAIGKALESVGSGVYLGMLDAASWRVISNAFLELLDHPARLTAMSERAYSLADGQGVERVCQLLG